MILVYLKYMEYRRQGLSKEEAYQKAKEDFK